jgi:signal-transduction protein with cAMP-binding, CBS, and nucleotidyltransferase domain
MTWIDFLGYAASASVLATFCMGTMVPLRIAAIGSNVLFIAFGALAHIYPVLILHIILLPVNCARLLQIQRLIQSVNTARVTDLSIERLLPFMSRRVARAGEILMSKGDKADRMYYLVSGKMEVREIGKILEAGSVLGEIGIFARDQKRMATVVCTNDCELYELNENKAMQLYFQDRSFGLALLRLIIARLMEDMHLLRQPPKEASEAV